MPSGKRAKQQRRVAAPPPVRTQGGGRAPRQASPRVLAIGGGIVVLVAIAIVLAVVLGRGSSSGSSWPAKALPPSSWLPGAPQVQKEFGGIPQHGLTLGSRSAPATMVEYIDLQCPYCDEFENGVMPAIVKKYIRTGKLKVVMRPLAFIGPDSVRGRNALIAASYQNKAFNFAALLYVNQRTENTGWLSDGMIEQAAESIPGTNPSLIDTQRNSSSVAQIASASDHAATQAKVNATPTLFVGKSLSTVRQVAMTSPTDEATLVAAINATLGK